MKAESCEPAAPPIVRFVSVPPAMLLGLPCCTYVSSAVEDVWLHVPFVRGWLQAWSFFELSPGPAAEATPADARTPTTTRAARRRRVRRRIVGYSVRESA